MAEDGLVRHFLGRFIDNDLISPDADRHEVLAVTVSALSTSGLFLAVLLSMRYLFRPLQSRGWTALVALEDTFLWCGLSMIVMGLLALAAWDALALDARDAAILRVLPVSRRRVVGAQLAALVLFALGFVVCVNVVPTLVAPLVRLSRLPIGAPAILHLVAAHAAVTTAAGVFGFVSVVAVRETLRAVLTPAWFERLAPFVQGVLVAGLVTCLLLMPALSSEVERRWVAGPVSRTPPPVWFVGLHERLAGEALIGLPPTNPPPDAPAAAAIRRSEAWMMARYASRRPAFRQLARMALLALGTVLALAGVAWAWNSRRWPPLARPRRTHGGTRTARVVMLVERWAARGPAERAGFAFARQALARSPIHRVWMALTLGAAMACAGFTLRGVSIDASGPVRDLPLAALAMQTIALMVLAVGYRLTTRVPLHLRAGLTFEIVGFTAVRAYVIGVKRAGVLVLGCPVIALLLALQAWLFGAAVALAHAVFGVLMLLVLFEGLFLRAQNLPLVSRHEPIGNVPALGTIAGLSALGLAWLTAAAERLALQSPTGTMALMAVATSIWLALAMGNRRALAVVPSRPQPTGAGRWLGLGE